MKGRGPVLLIVFAIAQAFAQPSLEPTTFQAVDIYVDSGTTPLAAYQIEFKGKAGNAKIVGIEGGESLPFNPAPHYDPNAIMEERVVIAAFSTQDRAGLPTGKTRVATIHLLLQSSEEPGFVIQLDAAANPEGSAIDASATFEGRKQR